MHMRLLTQWLLERPIIGHAKRTTAVARVVTAVLAGAKLTLTHLGRSLGGRALVKHQIKAVDRLLGNRHLHGERQAIYRSMAGSLLLGNKRPVILIDWSDFELGRKWLMIKAAVPVSGRAMTIYERVFPFKRYNSPRAHREFLRELQEVLPPLCRPIIVTDAGFRGPWFRAVEEHGWEWIGRIRNKIKYYREDTGRWCYTDSLYREATSQVRFVGRVTLARRRSYEVGLYLVRAYKPRRGRPRKRRKSRASREYRRLHRAPWLLASSLPHTPATGKLIKSLYGSRMQIEETFRDLKNHRWGLGLRYARCHSARRLEILLLLGTLAMLVIWLVGLVGRNEGWNRHLQANTERKKEVLSTFFIGRQLLQRQVHLTSSMMVRALFELRRRIRFEVEL